MDLKNFVFPISVLLDLVKVSFITLVQWSGILYIPAKIRNAKTLLSFKKKIEKWTPSNCQCQVCVDFLDGTGFTNI